jgi:hypothetical protein
VPVANEQCSARWGTWRAIHRFFRRHPRKRFRPLISAALAVGTINPFDRAFSRPRKVFACRIFRNYSALSVTGVGASRETSASAFNARDAIGGVNIQNRIALNNWLNAGNYITYNNGDPYLFNTAAIAMMGMIQVLKSRNKLKSVNKIDTYIKISRFPVDTVTHMQKQLCKKGTQVVGGEDERHFVYRHSYSPTPGLVR